MKVKVKNKVFGKKYKKSKNKLILNIVTDQDSHRIVIWNNNHIKNLNYLKNYLMKIKFNFLIKNKLILDYVKLLIKFKD